MVSHCTSIPQLCCFPCYSLTWKYEKCPLRTHIAHIGLPQFWSTHFSLKESSESINPTMPSPRRQQPSINAVLFHNNKLHISYSSSLHTEACPREISFHSHEEQPALITITSLFNMAITLWGIISTLDNNVYPNTAVNFTFPPDKILLGNQNLNVTYVNVKTRLNHFPVPRNIIHNLMPDRTSSFLLDTAFVMLQQIALAYN